MNKPEVTLQVKAVQSRIFGGLTDEVLNFLDTELSYDMSGATFAPTFMSGRWDGRKHLFSTRTQTLPTGLVPRARRLLDSKGYRVLTDNQLPQVVPAEPIPFKLALWDWQGPIVKKAVLSKRGVVKSPTGSGKGVMLWKVVAELNQPTMLLVHKRDLLWQLGERWEEYTGLPCGRIGDGKVDIQHVTIAMMQTLIRSIDPKFKKEPDWDEDDSTQTDPAVIKEFLNSRKVVVSDECHRIPSKTAYTVLKKCPNTAYRYGWSATTQRDDGSDMLLEAAIGPQITDISIPWLVAQKYLAEPTIYFIKFKHKKAPKGLNYMTLYSQEIAENEERNKLIVKLAYKYYKKGHKILLTVNYIKHGKMLLQMLQQLMGDDVRFIHGDTKADERKTAPKELSEGKFKIGIATSVWKEGVDIPGIDVLIAAGCGKSRVATLQIAGRVLRRTETKTRALLLDIYDTGCRFFKTHADARIDAYQQEGLEVKTVDASKV